MQKYQNSVTGRNGDVVIGGSVLIKLAGTATPATIYSDDGVTPTTNPLTTDANGYFEFYAADGLYDIAVNGQNAYTAELIVDALTGLAGRPTSSALADAGAAALIGATVDGTVQAALDAKVKTVELAAAGGGGLVGLSSGRTAQDKSTDVVAAFDSMTSGQRADVRAGTLLLDVAAAVNTALASGGRVVLSKGKYLTNSAINLSVAGTELCLEDGAELHSTLTTSSAITVSAAGCSITGAGKIVSPATFLATVATPTYGVVYVTADDFLLSGVTIDTIPHRGLVIRDCTNHRVESVRFVGRYPSASYNEATTTGHFGILYDQPSDPTKEYGLVIDGCMFDSCIQGVSAGNFGSANALEGLAITGSVFRHCWDHGIYLDLPKHSVVVGNYFYECRRPIVSGGDASVVVGNAMFSSTASALMEQMISLRDATNCVVTGNTIYGYGAGIAVEPVSSGVSVITGNLIASNVLFATGPTVGGFGIRFANANTCSKNKVLNNVITAQPIISQAAIFMNMPVGQIGYDNEVAGNTILSTGAGPAISTVRQTRLRVEGNSVEMNRDAGSAETLSVILLDALNIATVRNNKVVWETGGTNVSARGITISGTSSGNTVADNGVFLTSASLTAAAPTFNIAEAQHNIKGNLIDSTARLAGTFILASGVASQAVTNANVTANSRISVVPRDAPAGVIAAGKGFYVTQTAGSFTIFTADATNTASTSTWRYWID